MASESTSKVTIDGIPNNVSGDGKSFVAKLKQFLRGYSHNVEELIENSDNNANVSQVANLILAEHVAGGKSNIQVSFVTTNVVNYSFAQVWVRTSKTASWVQNGITSGTQYIIENATMGATYYVKVVACSKESGFANFDRAPEQEIAIRGGITICNTPTQFYWDNASKRWVWGGYVDNGATDFFEVRLDENPGVWDSNRLDATTNMYSTVAPPNRSGTAYLYVRNTYGQYNLPAVHIYSVTGLSKPTAPTLKATVDGVVIDLQGLPSGAYEYVVDVDGTEFEITSQQWTYYKFSGSITVKYCFVDSIGRSEWSNTATLAVGRQLGSNDIAANAITAGKIATNAVTADKINAGAITAGKIAADAIKIGGTGNNVTIADGAINGSKITANSIIGDKIAANTITASKLAAENIAMSGDLSISGGVVRLDEAGLHCNIANGSTINFNSNGMSVQDSNGRTFSQIARLAYGVVNHNEYVNLNWDVTPRTVLMIPYSAQSTVSGYTSSDLYIKCFADNVSSAGFRANCYTTIASGSYAKQYLDEKLNRGIITNDDGHWREENWYTDFAEVNVPQGASAVTISASASFLADYFQAGWSDAGAGGFMWETVRCWGLWVQVYVNNQWVADLKISNGVAIDKSEGAYTHYVGVSGTVEKTITVQATSKISLRAWGKTYSRRSEGPLNLKLERSSVTANVTGDTVISQGSATYFAIG